MKPTLDYLDHERVVSVSGGKDSTALYLLAVEHGDDFAAVFADTGNEHFHTLQTVERLSGFAGGPAIRTVRASFDDDFVTRRENIAKCWPEEGIPAAVVERALAVMHPTGIPFLDVCLLRSGFPSPTTRFCTDYLKIRPILEHVYRETWDRGHAVESWQGVRAAESAARALLTPRSAWWYGQGKDRPRRRIDGPCHVYRPLLSWTVDDVWKMHARHGFKRNPLYDVGASRVGCAPCIMSKKGELRMWSERFPEEIDRVEEWERLVALAGKRDHSVATLINAKNLGVPGPISTETHGIRAAVDWSRTSRGGRQYDALGHAELYGPCSEVGVCE